MLAQSSLQLFQADLELVCTDRTSRLEIRLLRLVHLTQADQIITMTAEVLSLMRKFELQ
ncbi:hypothetical protein D3C75_615550 [compost metagenome]